MKKKPEDVSLVNYLDSIEASLLRGLRSIEEINEKPPIDDETLNKYWSEVKATTCTNGSGWAARAFPIIQYITWLTDEHCRRSRNYTDRYLELLPSLVDLLT